MRAELGIHRDVRKLQGKITDAEIGRVETTKITREAAWDRVAKDRSPVECGLLQ